MNDNAPPWCSGLSATGAQSMQRLRDWRYFVDYMFELCPGLAYVVTKVDCVTEHGNVHSAEMWGQYHK